MNFWKRLLAPLRPHPMAAIATETLVRPNVEASVWQEPNSTESELYDFTEPGSPTTTTQVSVVSVSVMPEAQEVAGLITDETAPMLSQEPLVPSDAEQRFDAFAEKWDAYDATKRVAAGDDEQNADDPNGTLSQSLGFGPGQPTAATTRWRVSVLPSEDLPVAGVERIGNTDRHAVRLGMRMVKGLGVPTYLSAAGQSPTG